MLRLSGLVSVVKQVWEWWRSAYLVVWTVLQKSVAARWALVVAVVGGVLKFITWIAGAVNDALAAMSSVSGGPDVSVGELTFVDWLRIANMVLPITDWCAVGSILVVVAGAIGTYRFVKSWIPTVSGT